MKVAYPCPKCGEVILSNKCKSCGYELMPEIPKPKIQKGRECVKKAKPKKLGKLFYPLSKE